MYEKVKHVHEVTNATSERLPKGAIVDRKVPRNNNNKNTNNSTVAYGISQESAEIRNKRHMPHDSMRRNAGVASTQTKGGGRGLLTIDTTNTLILYLYKYYYYCTVVALQFQCSPFLATHSCFVVFKRKTTQRRKHRGLRERSSTHGPLHYYTITLLRL